MLPEFAERSATSVPGVVLLLWGGVVAYGYLTAALTGCSPGVMPLYYLGMLVAFIVWHWAAHQKWTGVMHETHMHHHHTVYPPAHFFGRPGQAPTGEDFWRLDNFLPVGHSTGHPLHEGPLFILVALELAAGRWLGLGWDTLACVALFALAHAAAGVALHNSFHVRGIWLEKYEWYQELRALHYIHHLGSTKHNYAVFNFALDKLLGAFLPTDPAEERKLRLAGEEAALPEGIHSASLAAAAQAGGVCAAVVGMHAAPRPEILQANGQREGAYRRGTSAVAVRAFLVVLGLWAWFESQSAIRARSMDSVAPLEGGQGAGMADRLLEWSQPWHAALAADRGAADRIIAAQATLVDGLAVVLLAAAIVGHTVRPLVAVAIAFAFRQACQLLFELPPVPGSLWRHPEGVGDSAHFLVTFQVENDLFFCGHTALAAIVAVEVWLTSSLDGWVARSAGVLAGLGLLTFMAASTLALRSNWGLSVVVGAMAGGMGALASHRLAPLVDAQLP